MSGSAAFTDLRGLVRIATHLTGEVADVVEGVHQSVWRTLGLRSGDAGRARGLTGLVYGGFRAITRGAGRAAEGVLDVLQATLGADEVASSSTFRREALLAALNGVLGDRLAAHGNPLTTPMTVHHDGGPLDLPRAAQVLPDANGNVLLLIHGLCMNDLQWRAERAGQCVDHGRMLAAALGCTPLYLRYNSGLHVWQNGRELAALLERLFAHWPVPVERLTILAHSMGGLVARSAVQYARADRARWPAHLRSIVFLGTPHHGAPLERAGNWLDAVLGATPWSAPFARLGRLRSAGITDLRFGHLCEHDHDGQDRFLRRRDQRRPVPLPDGVDCYTIAAARAARRSPLADRLVGDGLVPLRSALGEHDDPRRTLSFPKASQRILWRTGHLDLLSHPEVGRQLLAWLTPGPKARPEAMQEQL